MALLNVDDSSSVRVLPKVFADVPSAEELAAAKKKVDEAKAAAGRMGLIAGVLGVALVAVTGFLGYTMSKPPEGQSVVVDLQDKLKKADLAIADSKKVIEGKDTEIKAISTKFDGFGDLATSDTRTRSIKADIDAKMGNLKDSIRRDLGAYYATEWKAYDNTVDWPLYKPANGDWKAYVSDNLNKRSEALAKLKIAVDGWTPKAPAAPKAPCPPLATSCP